APLVGTSSPERRGAPCARPSRSVVRWRAEISKPTSSAGLRKLRSTLRPIAFGASQRSRARTHSCRSAREHERIRCRSAREHERIRCRSAREHETGKAAKVCEESASASGVTNGRERAATHRTERSIHVRETETHPGDGPAETRAGKTKPTWANPNPSGDRKST